MRIEEISNKEQLNGFAAARTHSQFLQSWDWGEIHGSLGGEIRRIAVTGNNKIIGAGTFIKKKLPLGAFYWFCPRGPVVKLELRSKKFEIMGLIFNFLKSFPGAKHLLFIRFEPTFDIVDYTPPVKRSLDVEPSRTLMLDLRNTPEELLSGMHHKTRYNIKLAQKKPVEAGPAKEGEFDDLWQLMKETSSRNKFRIQSREYYMRILQGSESVKLYVARHEKRVIAAALASFFGDTVTYLHGGSSYEHRSLMPTYILQWRMIEEARRLGYTYYDFYGIDDKKWPGVTKFKKGFGGQVYEYPGTFDLTLKPWIYPAYKAARRVRRILG